MKNMKVNILGSLVLVVAFIIIGISVSFAYYTNAIKVEGDTSLSVSSGGLVMNFTSSKYIEATSTSLINEADILKSDNYTEFSISYPAENTTSSGSYNLFLTNIKLTSNYKSSDVKWALYDASNNRVGYGDFSNVTLGASSTEGEYTLYAVNDNISILDSTSISKGTTVTYKLYVWLNSNPSANQNGLLNGKISARVGFKGVSK